jgi:hypothetical protein
MLKKKQAYFGRSEVQSHYIICTDGLIWGNRSTRSCTQLRINYPFFFNSAKLQYFLYRNLLPVSLFLLICVSAVYSYFTLTSVYFKIPTAFIWEKFVPNFFYQSDANTQKNTQYMYSSLTYLIRITSMHDLHQISVSLYCRKILRSDHFTSRSRCTDKWKMIHGVRSFYKFMSRFLCHRYQSKRRICRIDPLIK